MLKALYTFKKILQHQFNILYTHLFIHSSSVKVNQGWLSQTMDARQEDTLGGHTCTHSLTHTHTLGKFRTVNPPTDMFLGMEESKKTLRKPTQTQAEHAKPLKGSKQKLGSNQGPWISEKNTYFVVINSKPILSQFSRKNNGANALG